MSHLAARFAALVVLMLACSASVAAAATQTFDDPDDGISMSWAGGEKELDIRRVVIDQIGETTRFDVTIEAESVWSANDTLILFLDANEDGKSERFVSFYGFSTGTYSALAGATPDSTVGCQRTTNHGTPFTDENKAMPAADGNGQLTFSTTIPTAQLGGATQFRWAVYSWNDSFNPRPSYDYAPNTANPRGAANAVADHDPDGCDTNADGAYGDETVSNGAWPVAMTGGELFGAAPSTGGGGSTGAGTGGGGTGSGVGPSNPLLPDPVLAAIPAPDTLRTLKMPDLGLGSKACGGEFCTLARAKAQLAKAGIRNYRLATSTGELDDIPSKKWKKRVAHEDVVRQKPAPGADVPEPNVAAYPEAKLPTIKLALWEESELKYGCKDERLAGIISPKPWPGTTTGSGNNRVWGAEELLKRLKCEYDVSYRKKDVATPTIDRVRVNSQRVDIRVAMPKTVEFQVFATEGVQLPRVRDAKLVGLLSDDTLPTTGEGEGMVAARVMQTSSIPSLPAPAGVTVTATDAGGGPVAIGKTDRNGIALLRGYFVQPGRYTLVAYLEARNGLTMDGTGALTVRKAKSPAVTESGRRFAFTSGRWKLQAPKGKARITPTARGAQSGDCVIGSGDEDYQAGVQVPLFRSKLLAIAASRSPEERAEWTGRFINQYLGARDLRLLERRVLQDFFTKAGISVTNLGAGTLKPVTSLCDNPTPQQAVHLARGYDLKSGPLPVIESAAGFALPDGSAIGRFNYTSKDFVIAPALPAAGQLRLSLDERVALLEAVISTGGGNVGPAVREALGGVISTGGGNVISTGGGNIISTDGASLTVAQLRGIMGVISTGGGNVISTGGGNLTAAERAAAQQIMATGNVISTGGGNLTVDELRSLLRVIATGGGNIISTDGAGLTAAEQSALGAVISTGGGNVISTGGGNLAAADTLRVALQGVIATGGGNLSQRAIDVVQSVISTGGGNVISTGGGNAQARQTLGSFVGSVISTGGGNVNPRLVNAGKIISTDGAGIISTDGSSLIGQAGGNLISDKGLG